MRTVFYIMLLFFTILIGCTEENELSTNSDLLTSHNITAISSNCHTLDSTRLKVNDEFSLVVYHCYISGQLVEVEYNVSTGQPGDTYAILDLRPDTTSSYRMDIINSDIDSINESQPLAEPVPDFDIDDWSWGCTCNEEGEDIRDCSKQTMYGKIKFCEGNACAGCSVIIWWEEIKVGPNLEHELEEKSIVFLPKSL